MSPRALRYALAGILALAACRPAAPPPGPLTAPVLAAPVLTAVAQAPEAKVPQARAPRSAPPEEVPTRRLARQDYRITFGRLPRPVAQEATRPQPRIAPPPPDAALNVPSGFRVNVFARDLDGPTRLALTPDGDVLVAETPRHRLRLLRDLNDDGVAEEALPFAQRSNGLDLPFGLAFGDHHGEGYLFVANATTVRRFRWRPGQTAAEGAGEWIAELPALGPDGIHDLAVAPDGGHLFVAIGAETEADPEPLPRGSVQRMRLDGTGMITWAWGLHEPVGLAFQPGSGRLFAAVRERDGLGEGLVPDYLARLDRGQFYGWPYTYLAPGYLDPRRTRGEESIRPDLAQRTETPEVLFQPRSGPLGATFYDTTSDAPYRFPLYFRDGVFVAFQGGVDHGRGTGFKLAFVPFRNGLASGTYEDFLTGFLVDEATPTTWGRPAGVLVMPDGSLLFSDSANGRVYRVRFEG